MNPCKDCIVDMVCIKKCPIFKIDLDRLQTDEKLYLKRCMNNINYKTYELSKDVMIEISFRAIYWWKNNRVHRDNNRPAAIYLDGGKRWYKNGVEYEPM